MKSLSATLLTHQKGSPRSPALRVLASATRGGFPVLRWARWYTGAEADAPHNATVADDGSLIRVRNDGGNLQVSRVAAPVIGSTYSSWTLLQAGLVVGSGLGLASRNGELVLNYTRGTSLYVRTSADDDATWSAETLLFNEGAAIGAIATGIRQANGDACVFYGNAAVLKRARRTAGAWAGAGTAWTPTAAGLTGIAANHDGGDYVLTVTGTETTTLHKRVWGLIFGDGGFPLNTWSGLVTVQESDAASGLTFAAPSFAMLSGPHYASSHMASEAGAVARNQAYTTWVPGGVGPTATWAEPQPFGASAGLLAAPALAFMTGSNATQMFATTPSGVWRAAIDASSDLSARVLRARLVHGSRALQATVELDNADGALAGHPSGHPALFAGGSIEVWPGYASGAAGVPEYGVTYQLVVDRVSHVLEDGRRVARIEASGPYDQLARFRFPQAWHTAAGALTRSQVLNRIVARAGFASSLNSASADWTAYSPSFAVVPGESAARALERLLAVVDDQVRQEDGLLRITSVPFYGGVGLPAAVYAYSNEAAGDHDILGLRLIDQGPAANVVRLQGRDRYAEDFDESSVYQHGTRRAISARHSDADSNTKASAFADNALDRELATNVAAELTVPVNGGQELYDVVEVTYPALGLAVATPFRVLAIELVFDRSRPAGVYTMTLTLGAP